MMGGSDTGSGNKDGVVTAAIHIPIGWQRRLHGSQVVYVSPSGTSLSSLDEVKTYLLTDGTCKCGLECPLVINKVFNFTMGVKVEKHKQPLSKAEQDMTKLCNHRRKVVAMAALCRSMQASQLPFAHLHHSEVSKSVANCNPKRALVEREEEDRSIYHPKFHPAARPQNSANPNPCTSPNSSHKNIYPHNGSSPGRTGTNSHHALEALRRFHHPLPQTVPLNSSSTPPLPSYHVTQRSPRTPTPQNVSQSQKTSQTPESPASPLCSPPRSSPKSFAMGGRASQSQAQHPHGVVAVGSPLSPAPVLSPPVQNMNSVSPQQRSHHASGSPSLAPPRGGSSTVAADGLTSNHASRRRKSFSSSPRSPVPCGSPHPSPHIFKFKLEDILEQFKNSGNNSTNNNHLQNPANIDILTNQSSHSHHTPPLKPSSSPANPNAVPGGFGLNSAGITSASLGPFLNHHSPQVPSASFPASSLLSAAAKAQLASQVTQGQDSNVASSQTSVSPSLETLTGAQQKLSTKVTNSTLKKCRLPSPIGIAASRPHYPSLAAASSVLFTSSHSLAQSLASSFPQLSPKTEKTVSHSKRRRRSPTVLSMIRDTQPPINGSQKTPSVESVSATAINLSSSACLDSSDAQSQNSVASEHHRRPLPGQIKFLTPNQTAHLSGPSRQEESLDISSSGSPMPLCLDPPNQPLSALLHLLSVQNAQAAASASHSAPDHLGSLSERSGHARIPSPTLSPKSSGNRAQTPSPCRTSNTNTIPLLPEVLSPPRTTTHFKAAQSPSPSVRFSPLQRHSPTSSTPPQTNVALHNSNSPSVYAAPTTLDGQDRAENHIPTSDAVSRVLSLERSPQSLISNDSSTAELSHSQGTVAVSTSPKPLDLSNHVLALLAASSTVRQEEGSSDDHRNDVVMSCQENYSTGPAGFGNSDMKNSTSMKQPPPNSPEVVSSPPGDVSPQTPSALCDSTAPLPLAEAFPFMNQDQLLQLLSSTGGLPSILDPTVLSSLQLGGLWLGGQNGHIPPSPGATQNLAEQQPILIQAETQQQSQDQQQKQQQLNNNPLFPLLPLLSGMQGDLPLNLMGLLNPIPPSVSTSGTGQESDLGLTEKPSLQALLMASLLLGQNQTPLLPLSGLSQLGQVSMEVPLQQPPQIPTTLEGLTLDKTAALLDPSTLHGSGLLEVTQGLPLPPGAEGTIQALQSLLLPATLPPHPATFLPFNPAILTAALNTADLPSSQLTHVQHTQPQELSDAGVDTLIPLSLQGKENPILQQLLPSLLNPSVLGDISGIAGIQNMVGIGAGSILLPSVQTSSLSMPLLHGPDGTINLLNNLQLNLTPPAEGEKSESMLATQSPAPHVDIPASQISPEEVASPAPTPAQEPSRPAQRGSDGRAVIDPYTSFMDTIYTSFLQINAKEQEGGHSGPSDPTSPFCALPPVTFPMGHHTLSIPTPTQHQASAPVSLSPRRACSLRNPDLSRLSLEAAAHSPAQGTPKPSEDVAASPLQRKTVMVEGHTHPEPPLPSIYLEEAKTDCMGLERQTGYLSPRDGCSGSPRDDMPGALLRTEQGREQSEAVIGSRRGRKRKQTLQNVLEDFRDLDATTALEETDATTTALLKPDTLIRGRRRRGARPQRQ
ncbi:uncharacterized protein mbd6 [Stigmatopora nigra]